MSGVRERLGSLEPAATSVLGLPLAVRLARAWRRGGAAVLTYHRVREPGPWDHPFQVVSPARFREHAELLSREARIVALDELHTAAGDGRPRVAITFDDGYRELLDGALPVLAELGAPSTVFCCSAVALEGAALWWDEIEAATRPDVARYIELRDRCARAAEPVAESRGLPTAPPPDGLYMDADDMRAAERLGARIGSHARTHARLSALDDERLRDELAGSAEALSAALGREVDTIAYPYGDPASVGPRVVEAARAAGYRTGLVVRAALARPGGDPLAIPRVTVYERDRPRELAAKGLGAFPGVYDFLWRRVAA